MYGFSSRHFGYLAEGITMGSIDPLINECEFDNTLE